MHVSIAILGADLQLAALPATPIQLLHAARAAGFDAALPASLGDELVAEEALRLAQARGRHPVVLCACPCLPADVAGDGLASLALATCPPPVALARAIRLGQPAASAVHVTYIGECPGAADPAIDLRVPPDAFLRGLARRGIDPQAQPTEFTDRLPPDRRRFRADAGGAPAADQCEALLRRALVTPAPRPGADPRLALADALLAGGATFVDPGPLFGCHCAGAARALATGAGASADERVALTAIEGRTRLAAHEPPRATTPVVAGDPALDLRPTAQLVRDGVRHATPSSVRPAAAAVATEPAPTTARPTPTIVASEPTTARARFALARRARQRLVRSDEADPDPAVPAVDADGLPSLQAPPIEREVPLVSRPTPADAPPSVTTFFAGIVAPFER